MRAVAGVAATPMRCGTHFNAIPHFAMSPRAMRQLRSRLTAITFLRALLSFAAMNDNDGL